MSETQGQLLSFQEAAAADMPRRVCVGTVGEIQDGHVSEKSKKYIVQPIAINALGSGTSTTVYWLYRPEWLRPGFSPTSIKNEVDDEKEANGLIFVYRNYIAGRGTTSMLRGLCGSDEAFMVLSNRLLSLPEVTIEAVTETLRTFFSEDNENVQIGYVLEQQSTKTDEIDPETGKNVYIKENRYQIARKNGWFDVSDKALERFKKSAEKSNGRMIVCYDGEPF